MTFDPCPHKMTQLVLKAGAVIRQLMGLPEERNITVLYNETAPLLGIAIVQMNSQMADHLPSPAEMKNDTGGFTLPRKDCPKCGTKMSLVLMSICPSCKDSENGKYHSGWSCIDPNCKFITDKSEKFLVQQMKDLGIEIPTGSKQDMGIQTITDSGLK